jgi:exodeoxyribonuclease VII large subunit
VLPDTTEIELGVSDFVALLNQTLEFAYPNLTVVGELANFRVSKNRWVYFDLKDDMSVVKFFGTIYQLPGPLEDGMILKVRGLPKLHNLYGFSVNIANIQLAGEGTIKRAAELLQAKLAAEGLFDDARKRGLPYPPQRIGLVTSRQSAAYADFTKILDARWQGVQVDVIDVQVQGEIAPAQVTAAIEQFNEMATPPEVIILIRGGGSAEDLAAFSTEMVTRAVAASRVPTMVAIGHEVDLSLAELAADVRASTPSNAAELLVPDRAQALASLSSALDHLEQAGRHQLQSARAGLEAYGEAFDNFVGNYLEHQNLSLKSQRQLLEALNPQAILRRGYAIVRQDGKSLRNASKAKPGAIVEVQLSDGSFGATVNVGNDKGSK